jgi:hypothetical protein
MDNCIGVICWSFDRSSANEASKFQKNDRAEWYILLLSTFADCLSNQDKKALSQ